MKNWLFLLKSCECVGAALIVRFSPQEEVLAEDSAEAEGVVPSDSQDGAEVSQVSHSDGIFIFIVHLNSGRNSGPLPVSFNQ